MEEIFSDDCVGLDQRLRVGWWAYVAEFGNETVLPDGYYLPFCKTTKSVVDETRSGQVDRGFQEECGVVHIPGRCQCGRP